MRASPSSSLDLHLGFDVFAISAYFQIMTTFASQIRGKKYDRSKYHLTKNLKMTYVLFLFKGHFCM